MTVKEIVKKYLEENKFDGLCATDCGCELKDLMACEGVNRFGNDIYACVPGYKTGCVPESCPADGDCPFHISPTKPPPPEGKFCEAQHKCKDDLGDQWTCIAHLGEGPLFTCPYKTHEESQAGEYPCADARGGLKDG